MKIARANSLKRLLITARSDTREGRERDRQLPLARGERAEEPRGEADFTTRAVSGARDTPPRVTCWMGVLCVHRVKSISERDRER